MFPKGRDLVLTTFVNLMFNTVPGIKQALKKMFVGERDNNAQNQGFMGLH